MKELIQIKDRDGRQLVSARELYVFLEIQTDFTTWCRRMFEYGFEEYKDFIILPKNDENKISKSNPIDYALTLDCAKEISMIQRSDKGKQARLYFIECEKNLKELSSPKLPTRIELARMVIQSEEQRLRLEELNGVQESIIANQRKDIATLAPKAAYHDEVLTSKTGHAVTTIANDLSSHFKIRMTAHKLNRFLEVKGIQKKMKREAVWVLTAKYAGKGYTVTNTATWKNSRGETESAMQLCWTEDGRKFIFKIIEEHINKVGNTF